jgi:hypothetical protein
VELELLVLAQEIDQLVEQLSLVTALGGVNKDNQLAAEACASLVVSNHTTTITTITTITTTDLCLS